MLDADTSSRMQAAIAEVRAAADEAQRLVGELAWWTPASEATSVKSAAHSTQVGLDGLVAKFTRWSDPGSPAPSETDIAVFFDGAAELAKNNLLRQAPTAPTDTSPGGLAGAGTGFEEYTPGNEVAQAKEAAAVLEKKAKDAFSSLFDWFASLVGWVKWVAIGAAVLLIGFIAYKIARLFR